MDDIETLKQLYRDLCYYSMTKDAQGLERILAPKYTLTHMTGMVQTRDQYIDAVMDGTLNYYVFDHDAIDVHLDESGDEATIRGRSRVEAAVFGGRRNTWRRQQDLAAEKHGGRWSLTSSKASTY